MKRDKAKEILEEIAENFDDKFHKVKYTSKIEAVQEGIKAIDQIGYLKDRPCQVCAFNKGNGCTKWDCVFEV